MLMLRRALLAGATTALAVSALTAGTATAASTDGLPRLSGESCLTYKYDPWDSTLVTNHCAHGGMVSIDVWFSDPPCYYLAPGESAFFRHQGQGAAYFC
ncbi:hypothetical protein REH65_31040 [Saccharopolyspora sp. ID03-671]|uniref:hypothetical protein n=1 Tax=Saccharopolyspora sp. ID03-671 TaxID=3073066 RepID=UPI003254079C